MKRGLKKVVVLAMAGVMTIAPVITASAETWKQNAKGWWVERPDGSYLVNEWFRSPASGIWYYMGADGYMLTNTTTPDGYVVNADGAWVTDTTPSGQVIVTDGASLTDSDFEIRSTTYSEYNGQNVRWWWDYDGRQLEFLWFAKADGDDITTKRGITLNSSRADVINAYGNAPITAPSITNENDEIRRYYLKNDSSNIFLNMGAASYIQYPLVSEWSETSNYVMRFYFDSNDKVVCVCYARDMDLV